jgi:C-terminal processing protease CtpA/Prc
VFSKVRAKVSLDILPQFPLWARPIGAVLAGHVVSHSIGERAVRKPDVFFPGHTYLLVDNGSFSMAASFAAMFRDYRVGTIVGYETGGDADSFGGPHFFTLKNSRIHCAVAFTENVPSKPQAGDGEHGVLPDVQLNEQKLADFRCEQDPVLAFTLRYVRSGGGVGGR